MEALKIFGAAIAGGALGVLAASILLAVLFAIAKAVGAKDDDQ